MTPSGQYGELKEAAIEGAESLTKQSHWPNYTPWSIVEQTIEAAHPIYVTALEAQAREIERLRTSVDDALLRCNQRVLELELKARALDTYRDKADTAEQREAGARQLLNQARMFMDWASKWFPPPAQFAATDRRILNDFRAFLSGAAKNFLESKS